MSFALPAPLIVAPGNRDHVEGRHAVVDVIDGEGIDRARATVFGAILARSRATRGVREDRLQIFAADDLSVLPPPAGEGKIWLPHAFCWETAGRPSLAWELCDKAGVGARLGFGLDDVARWAARPHLLVRLVRMAAVGCREGASDADEHLSFRWVLAHQDLAARVLSSEVVDVEHVSLHVSADAEERVAGLFCDALGLIEIPRPGTIAIPGRWLQAGTCRIHLNSRHERAGEPNFPGTAPNHVCLAVSDLDVTEQAVRNAGFETRRAGSLGEQVWFQLPGGTVIELQPLPTAGLSDSAIASESEGQPPPSQQDSIF